MSSRAKGKWTRRITSSQNFDACSFITGDASEAQTPSKQGLNVPQSYKTFESAPPVNTNMIVSDEAVFPTSTCNDSDYEVISDTGKAEKNIFPVLGGHQDRIFHCSFCPRKLANDTELFLTASEDGSVGLWELCQAPYQALPNTLQKLVDNSPVKYGGLLTENGALTRIESIGDAIYYCRPKTKDAEARQSEFDEVYRIRYLRKLHGHHDECLRACWGHGVSSNVLASAGADGNVILWNLSNFQQQCVLRHGKQEQIYVCNFFPEDGSALLTGHEDKLSMWDVDRNMIACQWHFLKSNNHALDAKRADKGNIIDKAFVYCADGCLQKCTVATGLADGSIHLVDARSGVTAMSFKAHNSYICDVNFSLTDGNQLVSCSGNGSIKIWDLRNAGYNSDGITPSSPSCCVSFGRSKQKAPIYGSKWCNISSSVEGSSIYSWSADGSLRKYSTSVSTKMSTVTFVPPNDRFPIMSFDASRDGKFGLCCGGHNIRNNLHSKKASVYSRFHIICL